MPGQQQSMLLLNYYNNIIIVAVTDLIGIHNIIIIIKCSL